MDDYATLFDPLDAHSPCAPTFESETPAPVRPQVLLHCADALALLQSLPTNSIDALVTDPPYGLSDHRQDLLHECLQAWLAGKTYTPKGRGFMGRQWDAWVPGPEVWREALRVLKPGAHALVFAGTRSMDLMGLALRLAGFELRDSIGYAHTPEGAPLLAWTYGSGFPKSHDFAGTRNAQGERSPHPAFHAHPQAEGWGTALKPAWEPILIARKPLQGTVAENVLRYGTGAMNISGCRVATTANLNEGAYAKEGGHTASVSLHDGSGMNMAGKTAGRDFEQPEGRWPANLIHDGSDEVLAAFPQQITKSTGGKDSKGGMGKTVLGAYALNRTATNTGGLGDEGTPARFFYCAKVSRSDRNAGLPTATSPLLQRGATLREQEDADWATRNGNPHPTVKPTDLMRYLCRLVTPPGGTVLDCYMGSGSTGRGAVMEGFHFIGGDNDPANLPIARAYRTRAINLNDPPLYPHGTNTMATPSYTAFLDAARSQIEDLSESVDEGTLAAFEARVTAMSPAAREAAYENRYDVLAGYLGASAANQCSDDADEQEDAIAAAEDLAMSLLEARDPDVAIAVDTWLQSGPHSAAPKVARGMPM